MSAELWAMLGVMFSIIVQSAVVARWAGKWQERLERITLDVSDLRKWKHKEVTSFMTAVKVRLGLLEQGDK